MMNFAYSTQNRIQLRVFTDTLRFILLMCICGISVSAQNQEVKIELTVEETMFNMMRKNDPLSFSNKQKLKEIFLGTDNSFEIVEPKNGEMTAYKYDIRLNMLGFLKLNIGDSKLQYIAGIDEKSKILYVAHGKSAKDSVHFEIIHIPNFKYGGRVPSIDKSSISPYHAQFLRADGSFIVLENIQDEKIAIHTLKRGSKKWVKTAEIYAPQVRDGCLGKGNGYVSCLDDFIKNQYHMVKNNDMVMLSNRCFTYLDLTTNTVDSIAFLSTYYNNPKYPDFSSTVYTFPFKKDAIVELKYTGDDQLQIVQLYAYNFESKQFSFVDEIPTPSVDMKLIVNENRLNVLVLTRYHPMFRLAPDRVADGNVFVKNKRLLFTQMDSMIAIQKRVNNSNPNIFNLNKLATQLQELNASNANLAFGLLAYAYKNDIGNLEWNGSKMDPIAEKRVLFKVLHNTRKKYYEISFFNDYSKVIVYGKTFSDTFHKVKICTGTYSTCKKVLDDAIKELDDVTSAASSIKRATTDPNYSGLFQDEKLKNDVIDLATRFSESHSTNRIYLKFFDSYFQLNEAIDNRNTRQKQLNDCASVGVSSCKYEYDQLVKEVNRGVSASQSCINYLDNYKFAMVQVITEKGWEALKADLEGSHKLLESDLKQLKSK